METSRQTNVIPFPQIKGDRGALFGQALAEEFFEDLDALFMKGMHQQLAQAKALAALGDEDAASDIHALTLRIKMRLRHRERIRARVVSTLSRWARDAAGCVRS
jgi:predicted trehalose synthase